MSSICGYIVYLTGFTLLCLTNPAGGADSEFHADTSCDLTKNPSGCARAECSSMAPASCVHGVCIDGRCLCNPCWDGQRCDVKINKHAPVLQPMGEIYINHRELSHPSGRPKALVFAMATDIDDNSRCRELVCPCANIIYGIFDRDGKASDIFEIDNIGAVIIRQSVRLPSDSSEYYLTVRASNPDELQYSETDLVVHIERGEDAMEDTYDEHGRFKRMVDSEDLAEVTENNTIQFTLTGVSSEANSSQLQAGIKVVFRLTMDIPGGTFAEDVKIELYAEEGNFTFGVVCPPNVTQVGSNIGYDIADPSYDYDSDNPFLATAAYLSLGNVTNNNQSSAPDASQIVIEFAMTILNDSRAGFSDSELRWITAGVEFANSALIWVGQLGYYLQPANTNSYSAATASLSAPNPDSITALDFGVFTLSMKVYDMTSDVTLKVYGNPNGHAVTSICGVGIRSTGYGFCLHNNDVFPQFVEDGDFGTNKEVTFPFNKIINGGTYNDPDDSAITMDLFIRLPSDSEATPGNSYDVGVSIIVNDYVVNDTASFTAAVQDDDTTVVSSSEFELISASTQESEVIVGGSFSVRVKLKIPTGKHSLKLEASGTPTSVTMCRASVVSSGYNLPCIYSTCPDCSNDFHGVDGALSFSLDLGLIRNTGVRSDAGDDVTELDVWIRVPSGAATGSTNVQFTLKNDDGTALGSSLSTNMDVLSSIPASQDTGNPTFQVSVSCSSDDTCTGANGAIVKLYAEVTVPGGSTYSDVKLQVESSIEDNKELVGLCDARISRAGRNLGCLRYTTESVTQTASSTGGSSLDDRLEFSTGVVSNMLSNVTGNNDSFVVEIVLRRVVTDLADLTATRTVTLNAFLNGQPTSIFTQVVTMAGTVDTSGWDVVGYSGSPVQVALVVTSPNNRLVAPGTLATLTVTLTFDADTSYAYTVSAGVNQTSLSILLLKGAAGESDIPCGDPVYEEATLTSLDGDVTNQKATLDLGVVGSAITSPSSINLTLVVKLDGNRSQVGDSSEHWIRVSVLSVSNATLSSADVSIIADYNSASSLTAELPALHEVDFSSAIAQDIEIGYESSFIHSMTISSGTSLGYRLDYSANQPWLEFTGISLKTIGNDVGGLTSADVTFTNGLTAMTDLGFVACLDYVPSPDCKIELEVTVKARNDSGANHGDVTTVNSKVTVYTGAGDTWANKTLQFFAVNATEIKNYTSSFQLGCPASIANMSPGDKETCNITITVTDQDIDTTMEVVTTLNFTYVGLVVRSVIVSQVGSNIVSSLGSLIGQTATFTSYVNANSTQKDRAKMSLGILQNTEASLGPADNDIVVDIVVQLTDAEEVLDESQHVLSIGVNMDSAFIWVSNLYIQATRSGNEQPDLSVTFTAQNGSAHLLTGNNVEYRVVVQHTDASSAEAHNATLRMLLPPYIDYDRLEEDPTNGESTYPVNADTSKGLIFQISTVYFTDVVAFTVHCTINSSFPLAGKSSWNAVTPLETSYRMLYRDGNAVADGQLLYAPLAEINYSFTTLSLTPNSYVPVASCDSPVALGMEDSSIADCQISASSEPDAEAAAKHARVNGVGWKTEARAGDYLLDRYLKVDLGRKVNLTGLVTQGGERIAPAFAGDIAKFELLYSIDDALYRKAESDIGEFDHSKVYLTASSESKYDRRATHTLSQAVEARYVIVKLAEYNYTKKGQLYNVLRTEFYGCPLETIQTDVCQSSTTLTHEYDRGVVIDTNRERVYLCDTKTHLASGLQRELDGRTYAYSKRLPTRRCITLFGSPLVSAALGDNVRNVIGLDPTSNTLYGIARDSSSPYFISSTNDGVTWTPVAKSEWIAAQAASGFVTYTHLPLESDDGYSYGTVASYGPGSDPDVITDGLFNGLYTSSSAKHLDWNRCCHDDCQLRGYKTCQ